MTTTKTVGLVIAGVIVSVLFSGMMLNSRDTLGGVYNEVSNTFRGGLSVGTTNQATISATGAITTSGGVTLGSGAATTSLIANLFCMQIYPTSTATAVKLTATTTASGLAGGPLFGQFGTCP